MITLVTISLLLMSTSLVCYGWNLNSIKISDTYFASSVSLFKSRAFLTLPRTSCYNNLTNPTLVEVPWNGEYRDSDYNLMYKKKPYPNHKDQTWGRCKELQNAISAEVEQKRGRLWVLDGGTDKCPATIVVYNLYYNTEVVRVPLAYGSWSSLTVDTRGNDFVGGKVFVGGQGSDLLVFSAISMKMWRLKLMVPDMEHIQVSAELLAISKLDSVIYLTGSKSEEVFEMDLKWIRMQKNPIQEEPLNVNVTYLGNKLGQSSGMTTDIKGGLNYYMIRDYAVLRWDTSKPLSAENHNVLAQSYSSLPYVSCLFNGPQNGVWALVNPFSPETCTSANRTQFALSNEIIPATLEARVVKILQYNKRTKKSFKFE